MIDFFLGFFLLLLGPAFLYETDRDASNLKRVGRLLLKVPVLLFAAFVMVVFSLVLNYFFIFIVLCFLGWWTIPALLVILCLIRAVQSVRRK